jgi:probable HAF family extracellular repeat protein
MVRCAKRVMSIAACVLGIVVAINVPAWSAKPTPPPPNNIAYEYVPLGAGKALGMNDSGDVVGEHDSHAFVATFDSGYVREDLNDWINPDSGYVLVTANDINESGQIVGVAVDVVLQARAYRLTPGNLDLEGYVVVEDLAAGSADSINDYGDVAGRLPSTYPEAFLYTDDAGLISLLAFASGINQGWSQSPISINNSAQVAGGSFTYKCRGWRFTPQFDTNGMLVNGVMQSLGIIKENRAKLGEANANDINDLGQVVGSSTAGGENNNAYRYSDGTGILDLGYLAPGGFWGSNAEAFAINNAGEVAGRDHVAGRAFLYTNQYKMFELDSRVNLLPGSVVGKLWPKRINADGDICGFVDDAVDHDQAFVLRRITP